MDGNKDEALRCVGIAKEAIALSNKQRALKFIGIAQRLNHNLPVDDLLAACENLDLGSHGPSNDENRVNSTKSELASAKLDEILNGERNYTEEHEIVIPDKNKAPGSEEAFKKVSKAFKCLSSDDSRRQYDQTGLVDEFEYNQQSNVRRRRRRTGNDFFDDDFDPDEIFRSFFGQTNMFRTSHLHRTRGTANQQREDFGGTGPNLMVLLQILPFFIIFLLAYLPFSEPDYSLQKNNSYQFPKTTEKHGVEFYVKSPDFDQNFPLGSPARGNIEDSVIRDYINLLDRYCHIELQRRQWIRNMLTPHCVKLRSFGVA
ncbi:DnaJ heat shock amino-terminal domain protein [Actinidia rufa]|uniref:DnaJ heat shock amino-terminal domain protein n=1 Tax=Actinidia rufa TaxID=165716 RepID=A0A7J0GT86_9ERIC|nr:DnaJ heat shock amino-terminal domain protein [Actinidia rufa]